MGRERAGSAEREGRVGSVGMEGSEECECGMFGRNLLVECVGGDEINEDKDEDIGIGFEVEEEDVEDEVVLLLLLLL